MTENEALELAIKALKKQLPMRAIRIGNVFVVYQCPKCKNQVVGAGQHYCFSCGQALKWGEDDE